VKKLLFSFILLILFSQVGLAEIYWLSLYDDADEACAGLERHGLLSVECPEQWIDVDIVAGLIVRRDDRVVFDPLLGNHRAVSYWFVVNKDVFFDKKRETRFYTRVKGRVQLYAYFAAPRKKGYSDFVPIPAKFIYNPGGTSLRPGGTYHSADGGSLKGYHERVYKIDIEEVIYVITPEEYRARAARYESAARKAIHVLSTGEAAEAVPMLEAARELENDAGYREHRIERHLRCARDYAWLLAPESRDDPDFAVKSAAVVANHASGNYPVKIRNGLEPLIDGFLDTLPEPNDGFVKALIEEHNQWSHRDKKKIWAILERLGGPHFRALEFDRADAEIRRKTNYELLMPALDRNDYQQVLQRAEEGLAIDRKYGQDRKLASFHALYREARILWRLDQLRESDWEQYWTDLNYFIGGYITSIPRGLRGPRDSILHPALLNDFLVSLPARETAQLEAYFVEVIENDDLMTVRYFRAAEFLAVICSEEGLAVLESLKRREESMDHRGLVPEKLQRLIDQARKRLGERGSRRADV